MFWITDLLLAYQYNFHAKQNKVHTLILLLLQMFEYV